MILSGTVYILGALTGLACAILLLRGYMRGRQPLLLWSGLCFAVLALSNVFVFVDLVLLPQVDLSLLRLGTSALAMALMLYGLIWESH